MIGNHPLMLTSMHELHDANGIVSSLCSLFN